MRKVWLIGVALSQLLIGASVKADNYETNKKNNYTVWSSSSIGGINGFTTAPTRIFKGPGVLHAVIASSAATASDIYFFDSDAQTSTYVAYFDLSTKCTDPVVFDVFVASGLSYTARSMLGTQRVTVLYKAGAPTGYEVYRATFTEGNFTGKTVYTGATSTVTVPMYLRKIFIGNGGTTNVSSVTVYAANNSNQQNMVAMIGSDSDCDQYPYDVYVSSGLTWTVSGTPSATMIYRKW